MRKIIVLSLALCLLFSFAANAFALTVNGEPEDQTLQLGFRAYWTIAVTGQTKFGNARADGTSVTWNGFPDGEYTDSHVYKEKSIYIGAAEAWYNSLYTYDYWSCTIN